MKVSEMRAVADACATSAGVWLSYAETSQTEEGTLAYATQSLASIQIANYWRESANDIERSYE